MMVDTTQIVATDEIGIRWTIPPAGRERKRKQALNGISHLAIHIPFHLIAYSLLYVIIIYGVTLTSTPPKVIFSTALSFLVSILPYIPIYLLGWLLAFAAIYLLSCASESYDISDEGCAFKDYTGRTLLGWKKIKSYRIDADPNCPDLRTLKLKGGRTFRREYLFDLSEVDEAEIRRRMQEHSVSDAAGRPWFARRTK